MVRQQDKERRFDFLNVGILIFFAVVTLYPLYFVVIASISSPIDVNSGKVILFPVNLTFDGYREIFQYEPLWKGYINTVLYTALGTVINLVVTITSGYALSRQDLPWRRFLTFLFIFTLFFQGGLIPRYLVVKDLGLMNNLGAMIWPNALNVFYLMMCVTFFRTSIPQELHESARMDGCGTFRYFTRIVLPLSQALVAIMALYYGIFHWNSFFDAYMFLTDKDKYPIQVVLRDLIISNQSMSMDIDPMAADERQRLADLIKYGAIIFSSLPVLIVYPFLQRYFVKGAMIGAVKG